MKDINEQLAEALHLTAHSWRTRLDRRLRPLGYSRSSWMVLLHISREDGITHRELAERLGIEAPTLVRLIDRMESEKLLERRASKSDRRVKHMHLLPAGFKEVERIWASAADLRNEILSDVSKTDIITTLNVLQKIRKSLERLA